MRFDAVAFDLDGTLYSEYRLYLRALPLALGRVRRLSAFNASRQRMRVLAAEASASAPYGPMDGESFRAMEAALYARSLGLDPSQARQEIERDFYGRVVEAFSRVRPYPGLVPALDALRDSGLRLALLSDLPPVRKLELLGLSGRFEFALCSEDSGKLKPAAEPFEMLLSRLGLPPERVLYVGNSRRFDVAGAKAAGMASAIVTRRRAPEADLAFWDWRELVSFATSP
jgi:Predicted hydrolase (HAD superfamily)